jgi:type II secretory pathway pseudopilin PulG
MKHYNNMTRQAGMTLIELTVVLLILIGLAGLLVPYVGSFTQTTHDSTNSNNVAQLNSAMLRYVSEKGHLPPHVDTLITDADGNGTGSCAGAQTAGSVYCGLANTAMFTPVTYAADSVGAVSLAKSGINMAVNNDATIENKTFGTSTNMLMLGGNEGGTFAEVSDADFTDIVMPMYTVTAQQQHVAAALGRDPMAYNSTCYDYIGVGLGDNNELIQSTMAAAPIYFPKDAKAGPAQAYAHFIAILQVQNSTAAGCPGVVEKAKFLGVVADVPPADPATPTAGRLVGANTLLAQGWENRGAAN